MSVVLSQHLPLLATAPDGIQKLRGLILELAVRGKLVPQNNNDEPASELLKRIAKDHKRHALKQESSEDSDSRFALANGWEWVRFGDVAQHNSGKTLDKGRNTGKARPYITTSNLYWGRFDLSNVREMLIRSEELERCTARKNDLLICEGGEAGRAAVWESDEEVCFQNHVHRARFYGGINPYYAYRIFQRLDISGEINQFRKGVGISNLSGKSLASIPFPLPPLAEQHRIVAKVDELMALCDRLEAEQTDAEAAHAKLVETLLGTLTRSTDATDLAANWQRLAEHFDTLFTTESSLDALKQTILQLAVMGKLVLQDPNDEPAGKSFPNLTSIDPVLKSIGNIPAQWMLCQYRLLTSLVTSGSRGWKEFYSDSGAIFIRTQNIKTDNLVLDDVAFVDLPKRAEGMRTQVLQDDILITITGANVTKAARVSSKLPDAYVSQHIALTRPIHPELSRWLHLCFISPSSARGVLENLAYGDKPGLSLGNIRDLVLPIPPLAEQHRILAKVDELMALCDRLKADLAESRTRQARLSATLIESALQAA